MRIIRTFVLRLLADTDKPYQLRGALHSVADDANHPFADAQTLLDLLQQMTRDTHAQAQTDNANQEGGNDEPDD